jgi:penicillin-binding protein 2
VNTYLDGRREPAERRLSRFLVFGIVVVLAMSGLTARLFYLQIVNGGQFTALAAANRTVVESIPSTRGLIYDRAGRPLVTNVPMFAVKIRPADVPVDFRPEVVDRLAAMIGIDPAEINAAIDSNPGSSFDLVRIADDIDENTARLISESSTQLPGVEIAVEARREYPEGPLMSQIVGYTGPVSPQQLPDLRAKGYLPDDLLGKAGVESSYESSLRGVYGTELVERNARGQRTQVLSTETTGRPGDSLRLTIDTKIQKEAEKALKWGIKAIGNKRGVFIVMNPQTGEILAMVSLPTYDNNLFARGISNKAFQKLVKNKDLPLLNHAVQAHYPPGSTYKVVAGTGALADKKVSATTKVATKGYLTVGPNRYYDWNRRGFGPCDIYCGFGHSSDTYFFTLGGMLGIDRLGYWANQYGFGSPTGVDLPGEASGIVPTNDWKLANKGAPIFTGETYQASIGQGYDNVTPLQLINAYAALANGGKLYQPQVVREVIGPDGTVVRPFKPKLIHKMKVKASVLRTMRNAARSTVTLRHTYNLVDMPIKVAGKSGTAEFGERDAKGRLPYHSWFVGWVPKDPYHGSFDKTDSNLIAMAFLYDSRTIGNAGTEVVKYFYQLHFGIKHDYRKFDLMERGNFFRND